MFIRIGFEIGIDCKSETTLILALSPHSTHAGAVIGSDRVFASTDLPMEEFLDPFGNRLTRLVAPPGPLLLWSDCIVEDDGRPDPQVPDAVQHLPGELPPETLPYLIASRYCESDLLRDEAWRLFGGIAPGWARVAAITDFVHKHLTFGYAFGRPTKSATDALREHTGVCRDFAHLSVALCRAMSIPARYASGYLGDIGVPDSGPGDFCAWFEAYLGGRWHTFDARYNKPRIGRVLMVRGRDAGDGAMMTTFGAYDLTLFRVWTDEVPAHPSNAEMRALLSARPNAPALVATPANGRAHLESNVF